jgi:hypothetical protein
LSSLKRSEASTGKAGNHDKVSATTASNEAEKICILGAYQRFDLLAAVKNVRSSRTGRANKTA